MDDTVTELRHLIRYTRAANLRVLEACTPLSPDALRRELGGSFPSLWATLAHMLGAEYVWLRRWHGERRAPLPAGWPGDTLEEIAANWERVAHEQARFADSLTAADLARPVDILTFKDAAYVMPLGHTIRHVVNHATYHRGQAVNFLRQLGVAPPSTDLFIYYVETEGGR